MKYLLTIICCLMLSVANAQSIAVVADEAELDGVRRKGMSVLIELDKKVIDKAWIKKLKEAGRTDVTKTGSVTVRPAALPGLMGINTTAFGRTDQGPKGTRVFLAVDLGTEVLDAAHSAWKELTKYLYDFALQSYRDDLNVQITEADKAVDGAVKQNESAQDEGQSVKRRIERNQNERIRLIRQLKENEAEMYQLKADSIQNKIIQSSTFDDILRLRKIVEDKKTKLATY